MPWTEVDAASYTLGTMNKQADPPVNGEDGMARLGALTRRLLAVPNAEVQAALADEKRAKAQQKRAKAVSAQG
jgi:hypothetical protein